MLHIDIQLRNSTQEIRKLRISSAKSELSLEKEQVIIPSIFITKNNWINLIIDIPSFFPKEKDPLLITALTIGSQCKLKAI